jgi:hypothetical protein
MSSIKGAVVVGADGAVMVGPRVDSKVGGVLLLLCRGGWDVDIEEC